MKHKRIKCCFLIDSQSSGVDKFAYAGIVVNDADSIGPGKNQVAELALCSGDFANFNCSIRRNGAVVCNRAGNIHRFCVDKITRHINGNVAVVAKSGCGVVHKDAGSILSGTRKRDLERSLIIELGSAVLNRQSSDIADISISDAFKRHFGCAGINESGISSRKPHAGSVLTLLLNRQALFIGERTVFTNKNPDHLVPAGAAGRRQIFALERNRALIDKVGRTFSANPKKRSDLCWHRAVVGKRYFNFAALVVGKRARSTNTQAFEGICAKRFHTREVHRNQIHAYFAVVIKNACTDKLNACCLDALDISLNRTANFIGKRSIVDSQCYSFTVFLCG